MQLGEDGRWRQERDVAINHLVVLFNYVSWVRGVWGVERARPGCGLLLIRPGLKHKSSS